MSLMEKIAAKRVERNPVETGHLSKKEAKAAKKAAKKATIKKVHQDTRIDNNRIKADSRAVMKKAIADHKSARGDWINMRTKSNKIDKAESRLAYGARKAKAARVKRTKIGLGLAGAGAAVYGAKKLVNKVRNKDK